MQQYSEFKEKGPKNLELVHEGIALTDAFAYGIQTVKAMFDDVNFSRPFRIIVDYDPEQPRTIVKAIFLRKLLNVALIQLRKIRRIKFLVIEGNV